MNKNSIRKIIKSTLELIGAMATIILLVGFLNGYSVRLSSIWGYIIDENRGNDE